MDRERFFIRSLESTGITSRIGDDCVALDRDRFIVCTDSFLENVHFRRHWLSFRDLARKAFLVNISDVIAKNAFPVHAMLCISLPSYIGRNDMVNIIAGIVDVCTTYRMTIIGGDTTGGDRLNFSVVVFGRVNSKYLGRSDARSGDLLAYTARRRGDIGASLKALSLLLKYDFRLSPHNESHFLERFRNPILRSAFIYRSYRMIHACMDITDGLNSEIATLQSMNKLNLNPLLNLHDPRFNSGEEYELIFSFHPRHLVALDRIARACRMQIRVIGVLKHSARRSRVKTTSWH